MKQLTEVRKQILLNVRQGKDLYDGFSDSQLGGAIRSVHLWRGVWNLLIWDAKFDCFKLTDDGLKALETGEYKDKP